MKSTHKYCTIASKCRSPFSRKGLWEVVTIKIKTYKTKKATTRARTSLRRVRVRSLFLRAFAMAHGAYAWFARCVEAMSRISRALAYRIDIVHGAANTGGGGGGPSQLGPLCPHKDGKATARPPSPLSLLVCPLPLEKKKH